jgi:hypothetical protein
MSIITAVLAAGLSLTACANEQPAPAPEGVGQQAPPTAVGRSGVVLETMDAGNYTYVRVDFGEEEIWAAGPRVEVAVGDRVVISPGNPMKDFHSPSMDRTFELIYFVGEILPEGAVQSGAAMPVGHPAIGAEGASSAESGVDLSGIEKASGGLTVADVYERKAELAGSQVVVRGRVVKFNGGILGTNWLHIQDGSGSASDGTNDLTITCDGIAEIGETVVVMGTLELDKDFGAGYRYAAIVTDAQVTKE